MLHKGFFFLIGFVRLRECESIDSIEAMSWIKELGYLDVIFESH